MTHKLGLCIILFGSVVGCDSAEGTKGGAKTAEKAAPAKKNEPVKKAEPVKLKAVPDEPDPSPDDPEGAADEAATVPPVEDPGPEPEGELDEMADWYGLEVKEVDGWKPSFEADRGGIEWSKKGHVGVSMALSSSPIERVEDIEVGFMAGTELQDQDPKTTTPKGWYTTVTASDGKSRGFIYVRKIGSSSLVCDTLLSRDPGDKRPVDPVETLVEICDSADLPGVPEG